MEAHGLNDGLPWNMGGFGQGDFEAALFKTKIPDSTKLLNGNSTCHVTWLVNVFGQYRSNEADPSLAIFWGVRNQLWIRKAQGEVMIYVAHASIQRIRVFWKMISQGVCLTKLDPHSAETNKWCH